MPEGDTIYRTARALERVLIGRPITGFRSNYPLLTRAHEEAPFTGRIIERIESRGKWLLIYFSGDRILATHMRMSGSWHIYSPGGRWRRPGHEMRVVLENSVCQAVGFAVPVAEVHTARSLARDRRIPLPDADLLGATFDRGAAARRIRACAREAIGDVLLRQEVLAGLGNVFKSEVCFVAGVHPFAPVSALEEGQIEALVAIALQLLTANASADPPQAVTILPGPQRRTTGRLNPAESLWVYGRSGEPCRRCGARVRSLPQGAGARVTYWCPQCQPLPASAVLED